MLKLDVLFDVFWKDSVPEERIAEIAACGYKYVETWLGGDAAQLKSIGTACKENDMQLVSIVMNFAGDDAVAPVRKQSLGAFLAKIDEYSDNALAAGCHAGIVTSGNLVEKMSLDEHKKNMVEAMRQAGELVAKKEFMLNIEPLNTSVDHPGYYLNCRQNAVDIIKEVALDNVKILYDIYHMGIMGGNQTSFIEQNIQSIGHFHAAGIPGRQELFYSEINYPFLMDTIESAGYCGYFGLEYMPSLSCPETLVKTLEYLNFK